MVLGLAPLTPSPGQQARDRSIVVVPPVVVFDLRRVRPNSVSLAWRSASRAIIAWSRPQTLVDTEYDDRHPTILPLDDSRPVIAVIKQNI